MKLRFIHPGTKAEINISSDPFIIHLGKNSIFDSADELKTFLDEHRITELYADYEAICEDYRRMLSFEMQGVSDPDREKMLDQFRKRLLKVWNRANSCAAYHDNRLLEPLMRNSAEFDLSVLRRHLENFVSDIALLSLDPEGTDRDNKQKIIYRRHADYMQKVFNAILVSRQWSDDDCEYFTQLLLTPTVDVNDIQIIVSAITLSIFQSFDFQKYRCLITVYRRAIDENVRQRALVGWALALNDQALDDEEQRIDELVLPLLDQPEVRKELLNLQEQLVLCLEARKATDEINNVSKDMRDRLMRRQREMMDKLTSQDELDSILHPEKEEQDAELDEKLFRKFNDMANQGMDIYFGGFAEMKKFGFFYDMVNWFTPFYPENPALEEAARFEGFKKLMEQMIKNHPFCDSDMYSLSLAFVRVFNNLPAPIREAFKNGNFEMIKTEDAHSGAIVRRRYLQDLYRFSTLSVMKDDLDLPFVNHLSDCDRGIPFCFMTDAMGKKMQKEILKFGKFLYKHENKFLLRFLTECWDIDKDEFWFLRSYAFEHENATIGMMCNEHLLLSNPDNIAILRMRLELDAEKGDYAHVVKIYQHLTTLTQPDIDDLSSYSIALMHLGEMEQALNTAFQIKYQDPENRTVEFLLARIYQKQEDYKNAESHFVERLKQKELYFYDWIWAGFNSLMLKNVSEAVRRLAKAYSLRDSSELQTMYDLLSFEGYLSQHGYYHEDILVLQDMVRIKIDEKKK